MIQLIFFCLPSITTKLKISLKWVAMVTVPMVQKLLHRRTGVLARVNVHFFAASVVCTEQASWAPVHAGMYAAQVSLLSACRLAWGSIFGGLDQLRTIKISTVLFPLHLNATNPHDKNQYWWLFVIVWFILCSGWFWFWGRWFGLEVTGDIFFGWLLKMIGHFATESGWFKKTWSTSW